MTHRGHELTIQSSGSPAPHARNTGYLWATFPDPTFRCFWGLIFFFHCACLFALVFPSLLSNGGWSPSLPGIRIQIWRKLFFVNFNIFTFGIVIAWIIWSSLWYTVKGGTNKSREYRPIVELDLHKKPIESPTVCGSRLQRHFLSQKPHLEAHNSAPPLIILSYKCLIRLNFTSIQRSCRSRNNNHPSHIPRNRWGNSDS